MTLLNVELGRKVAIENQYEPTPAHLCLSAGMVLCAKATELCKTWSHSWHRECEGKKGALNIYYNMHEELTRCQALNSILFVFK